MSKKEKSIVKSGIILSLMTLASRIMGLVREMTRASFLGTSMFADAFSTAFMLPNLFRRLFAENLISAAFIPTFKEYLQKGDGEEQKSETQAFLSATFTLLSFCTTVVVVICIIFAPLITQFFCKAPVEGVENYAQLYEAYLLKLQEMSILTRIMFPYLITISIAAFFQGVLNGCRIFAPSGFTPVLFNLTVILGTYILSPYTANPARAMAIGTIAGGTIQALFQWPFVKKTGWKTSFTGLKKAFTNPGTRKVVALIAPTIIGIAAYQLNDVVSTILANHAGEGVTSSLQYSLRLQELILGIFAVSIGTVILPDLSGLAADKKWEEFNSMLLQAIKIMTLISIPATFYSIINGKEIITLLYKNNSFNDHSVMMTLGVFRFHMAGLLFIALNRVIAPAFYAQKNPKLPTIAGIINFGTNILFVLILIKPMSGNGIALALTVASFINTLFLFIFMKKMESMDVKKLALGTILYGLKIAVFSVIAAIPCYFVRPYLLQMFANHSKIISQGVPMILSFIIFAFMGVVQLLITKDKMTMVILKKFKR